MAAESLNRVQIGSTVAPQLVTDPTILDSVAGFINDVVPTAYNVLPCETDDKILWARFEEIECEESTFLPQFNGDNVIPPPLILVLGYTKGIQIWAVPATGEATQILSWRHGSVRILKTIPNPFKVNSKIDGCAAARPLIALVDSTTNYSTLVFRSLKLGHTEPVKQIQFKTSIINVLANKRSVLVAFLEKIAVFDAFTLDSRLSVTTCFLSPGIQQNPIALGSRWLAFADRKLNNSNRSGGGNEGEGVQSYTATVLHAAKSLGRGLRELTDAVAGSLTGNPMPKPGTSPNSPQAGGASDVLQKGVITILDIESSNINTSENTFPQEAMIAHFVAHTEAVVCLSFDPTGMLLLTADKRGHDFHLFRIQPHPCGAALASVHHLYILHRGDTSAKVQDMCFSPDSRWATVSTLRGTTHVFPITPYGGNISMRTHASAHVVNKMSRYQRSAGISSEGRSSSPVTLLEAPISSLFPYRNSRFPPYPQPTVVGPLAQIRQPVYVQGTGSAPQRTVPGRQRLPSSSEDNISLRVVTCFAPPRAWMEVSKSPRETTHKQPVKPIESLFIMTCHGTLIQYDLEPQHSSSVPKERISNDTPIELKVCARAQWLLHRSPATLDMPLPMSKDSLNLMAQTVPQYKNLKPDHNDEHWLSQVEIVTHLGPHRRLWMGPQFTFKTYTITNGLVVETRAVDVRRSKPVNMPVSKANAVLIESGSASSSEQVFMDTYHRTSDEAGSVGDLRLREDLADAMLEASGIREPGGHCVIVSMKPHATTKVVNPLGTVVTVQSDDEAEVDVTVEDAVIHENCDEALFRPVVGPKAVFYSENQPKSNPHGNILTKSLEANTEVAVRIINKIDSLKNNKTTSKHINKSRESSPKLKSTNKDSNLRISKTSKSELNIEAKSRPLSKAKTKIETKTSELSDPFIDTTPKQAPIDFDILSLNPELEKASIADSFTSDLFKDDPLFSSKTCKFEEIEQISKNESELTNSSEEEKVASKRTRKPKTKLGVKIPAVNKKGSLEDLLADPPKRSWNIVAAAKPPEKVEIKQPKTDLIDIETIEVRDDFNLLKIDKSSDDEKGDTATETTESDDSGKIPAIIDMDDDNIESVPKEASKSSRRKSKKKRPNEARDEDVSSTSSFSSASRASPTPSYSDNLFPFPGDSSSSM